MLLAHSPLDLRFYHFTDFLYSGDLQDISYNDVQDLLEILELSSAGYWDLRQLNDTAQHDLVKHITPATYQESKLCILDPPLVI